MHLAQIALLVPDYDAAIAWYTSRLGFRLREDTALSATKRWVVLESPDGGCRLLLARAVGPEQEAAVGRQGGGRVWLFLHCADLAAEHARMSALGVEWETAPREEEYGAVAVFRDPYGNRWDLIQPRHPAAP